MKNQKNNTKIVLFANGETTPKREDREKLEKLKIEKFKEQLKRAYEFRSKHFKNSIEIYKVGYLYELEQEKSFEGITRSYDLGYMAGYQAAQRNRRKKAKAAEKKK